MPLLSLRSVITETCLRASILSDLSTEHIAAERQFSSVAQSRPTLCNPMDYSMPDFPVLHQLPEFNQAHVH